VWLRARQAEAGIDKHIPETHQDAGVPHSDDPEKTIKGELWVGVTLRRGRSPVIWISMKRDPEGGEAKGGSLVSNDIKLYETRTPCFHHFQKVALSL